MEEPLDEGGLIQDAMVNADARGDEGRPKESKGWQTRDTLYSPATRPEVGVLEGKRGLSGD